MAEPTQATPREPEVDEHGEPISERRRARRKLLEDIDRHREAILRDRGGVPFDIAELDALLAEVRGSDGG